VGDRRGGIDGATAPEAKKVLAVQSTTPFQIMIPGYLPEEFERKEVALKKHDAGPAGEPLVELTYKTRSKTVRPSTCGNGSRAIRNWNRSRDRGPSRPNGEGLAAPTQGAYGDLGRRGCYAGLGLLGGRGRDHPRATPRDCGEPRSGFNKQVFTYIVDKPVVKDMEPPKPYDVPVGKDGVQEVTLVITPGGYDPYALLSRRTCRCGSSSVSLVRLAAGMS